MMYAPIYNDLLERAKLGQPVTLDVWEALKAAEAYIARFEHEVDTHRKLCKGENRL